MTITENVDDIHSMIMDDQRMFTKNIAGALAISRKRTGYFIHNLLGMRKLSAKWVPKCLNAGQKRDRVLVSQTIVDRFRRDPVGLFNRLVTMDETWVHTYDPEAKE